MIALAYRDKRWWLDIELYLNISDCVETTARAKQTQHSKKCTNQVIMQLKLGAKKVDVFFIISCFLLLDSEMYDSS